MITMDSEEIQHSMGPVAKIILAQTPETQKFRVKDGALAGWRVGGGMEQEGMGVSRLVVNRYVKTLAA